MRLESQSAIATLTNDDRQLHIRVIFKMTVSPDSKLEPESLSLEFEFLLTYSLTSDEGLEGEHLDAFARWIGFNNVWPYAREFIHSTTSRMGLPNVKLPLYRPEKLTEES
jgi:hypothetical protein